MDRLTAIDLIKQVPLYRYECELEKHRQSDLFKALNIALEALDAIEAGRLVEQKHGRWIPFKLDMRGCVDIIHYECSNCHKIRGGQTMYCPRCGAKMEITE